MFDDSVRVSARAARTGGSQVFLAHGEVFEDLWKRSIPLPTTPVSLPPNI